MQALIEREIQREKMVHAEGALRALREFREAIEQGRTADIPLGRRVILQTHDALTQRLRDVISQKCRGIRAKYIGHLRRIDPEVTAAICLRVLLNCVFGSEGVRRLQYVLHKIGTAIESQILAVYIKEHKPQYMDVVMKQIKQEHSSSIQNIQRKFRTAALDLGIEKQYWKSTERYAVAKLVVEQAFELGLFEFNRISSGGKSDYYSIAPSDVLVNYFTDVEQHLKSHVTFPVMLAPPRPWTDFYTGGYYIDELWSRAPMMKIRYMPREFRRWIIDNLREGCCNPAKNAMNKAQSVPYRVNRKVLQIARTAISLGNGALGLPKSRGEQKPPFPFGENWKKDDATEKELQTFKFWKKKCKEWYTAENTRAGRFLGTISKIKELVQVQDEQAFYCPTFLDWRGRLYFRSTLNPQSADVIKGCMDFAEGKRLGKEGLYWLWFHIANCCGYDKADPDERVRWAQEHWTQIQVFLNDPLNIDPPEVDTCWSLLQAGYAMQDALMMENPEDYECRVPVALDATCSGLQHYSAMFRDSVGGYFTNLIDDGSAQKHDIYKKVAEKAMEILPEFCDDPFLLEWWKEHGIPRAMAKRPVMTYVYGATLRSCIDYVYDALREEGIKIPDGYSGIKLCIVVGKALRRAVEQTVPKAKEGMQFLRKLVSSQPKEPLRWITPAGVPVINWSQSSCLKKLAIHSMGIDSIKVADTTGKYNITKALNGISPNFIHSMDSSHLVKVINEFDGAILPIHDSFGTHACDVGRLRNVLLNLLADLYEQYNDMPSIIQVNLTDKILEYKPTAGDLDLQGIRNSRFAFC